MWLLRLATMIVLFASVALATPLQAQTLSAEPPEVGRVREELRALFREFHAAAVKRDRAALEQIFAEEYVSAHASGFVDDRRTHLDDLLAVAVATAGNPPAVPDPFLNPSATLHVYGDVALLRSAAPGGPLTGGPPLFATTTFVKRNGRWQFVQLQGTFLQPERQAVVVSAKLLESYAGRYGQRVVIEFDGERLTSRGDPQIAPRLLTPVSDTRFYDKRGSELTFERAITGEVTHLTIRDGATGNVLKLERRR